MRTNKWLLLLLEGSELARDQAPWWGKKANNAPLPPQKKYAKEGPARGKGPPHPRQAPPLFVLSPTEEPGARFRNLPVALRARNKIFSSKSKKSMVQS